MDINILTAAGICVLICIIVYYIATYYGYKKGYGDCFIWMMKEWKKEHKRHIERIFGAKKPHLKENKGENEDTGV